jgi:RNA polymerase primary sigma factor
MRFDETKGFKFISFAVWWIRQSILLALAEQGRIVRLPLNKIGLNNKINIARQNFEQQNEREPSEEELSDMLDIDLTEVKDMLASAQRSVSMDSPLQEGEEGSLADVMCNPNADSTDKQVDYIESLQKEVQLAMRTLTDKQKKVVCYFFGIGVEHCLTLEDIGERFNLTRERVRQIKDKALIKMKSAQSCQNLKVFLG